MFPKLHAKGSSFKGLAAYLLNGKDGQDQERVAWTETRNLATQNPDSAWKVMAATALARDDLKAQAGIKNTGRRSDKVVQHLTLSWHPDEGEALTKAEMLQAADGAIKAIGADRQQTLIVAHDDRHHAHVHIVINRTMSDGWLLPLKMDQLKLSRWAEKYERGRGKILCEERTLNNAARDRGEYVKAKKDLTREEYELQQQARAASNDNGQAIARVEAEQRALTAKLARRTEDIQNRQQRDFEALEADHRAHRAAIEESASRGRQRAVKAVRKAYKPHWRMMQRRHQDEAARFQKQESSFLGRIQNAFASIDRAARWAREDRRSTVGAVFGALTSSGARENALLARQKRDERRMHLAQKRDERAAIKRVRAQKRALKVKAQQRQAVSLSLLFERHRTEKAALKKDWKKRIEDRKAAYQSISRDQSQSQGRAQAPSPGKASGKPSAAQAAKREASHSRSRSRTRNPRKPKRGGPSR